MARRLVVDARWVGPRPTGVGNSIVRQLMGLDRLLASGEARPWQVFAIRRADALESAEGRANWSGMQHIHTIDVDAPPDRHPAGDWWLHRTLPQLLRSLGADVLFSPAYLTPLSCPGAARVVMMHDDLIWSEPDSYPWRFRSYLALGCRLAAGAERLIFPSADARDRVAARLGLAADRTGVVPHGLDAVSYRQAAVARSPEIVFVASAETRKNHEVLLDALAAIDPSVGLHFVGFAPDATRDRRLREKYPHRWRATPQAPASEVARHLAGSVAMAHPSKGEGFGLPILEAMACGTPMVLSDIPVLREVAGDAALYAPPSDPASWATALNALIKDDVIRRRLVEAGEKRLQLFTLEESARALLRECGYALESRAR